MKPFPFILYFALLITLAAGCSNTENHKWPSLSPDGEVLCDSLEKLYLNDRVARNGAELIKKLELLTREDKNPNIHARILYWKSIAAAPGSDSAHVWIQKARELTDSAKYPYMFSRIVMADTYFDHNSYLKRHAELRNAILFFDEHNDKMMELFCYRVLSSFYIHIGDYDGFKQCAEAADTLCHEMKNDSLLAKNRINFVLSYIHSGDTVEAKAILNDLLTNENIRSDSDFMGRVYVNLGNLTSRPEYYQRAIEISPTFSNTSHLKQTLQFAMMKTYEANGDLEKADSLVSILAPVVFKDGDYSAKAIIHSILSRQARQRGDYKQALIETETSKQYFDSMFNSDDRIKVTQNVFKDEIARQKAQHSHERQLSNTRLLAMTAVLLLFCLLLWLYYKNRQNKLLMRQYASEAKVAKLNLDLEKEKRNLAALGLAMTERNNLIKDVIDIADRMHSDGTISTEAKNTISRMVKISQASQEEWDNFQIAYTRVHPHFIKKLKEAYPDISEGDARLSLYICAGLTTKQIALAMHLQPDSVKKNRQRLRQRMKINPDVSLEEELRKFL